ncbi:MAG: sugar phosphate isomerase/epimerase family protein [Anaerolineae bacterium]
MQPKPLELAYSSACFPADTRLSALADGGETAAHWIEVWVERSELGDTGAVRAALAQSGTAVWSVHAPFGGACDLSALDAAVRQGALASHRQAAAMAVELGAGTLIAHGGAEPVLDGERNERLAYARESVMALAADCRAFGLRLAVEFLPRSCPGHDPRELAYLLDDCGESAGVCLDVNHANLGQDLVANVHALGSRIISVHVSDNDGEDERHWLPGQGIIDWAALVAALRRVGYAGPFLYESGHHRDGVVVTPAMLSGNYRRLIAPMLAEE